MNILLACYTDINGVGGGGNQTLQTARLLKAARHHVRIISKGPDGPAEWNDCPVTYFQHNWPPFFWRVPELMRIGQLLNVLENQDKPDLFIAVSPFWVLAAKRRWPGIPIMCLFAARLTGSAIRVSHPGHFWERLNNSLLNRQERRALLASDTLVVQSAAADADITRFLGKRHPHCVIIPPGVAPAPPKKSRHQVRTQYQTPPDVPVVLTVGHLDENKDPLFILEGFARANTGEAMLWIAGDGPLMQDIEKRIKILDLTSHVRLLGNVKDIADVYAAADIYVHAAKYEAFGLVYLEAMAAGLPVLGPAPSEENDHLSSLKELLNGRNAGFCYPPGDIIQFFEKLTLLLEQGSMRQRMGAEGRTLATRRTWEIYGFELARQVEILAGGAS